MYNSQVNGIILSRQDPYIIIIISIPHPEILEKHHETHHGLFIIHDLQVGAYQFTRKKKGKPILVFY